MEEARGKAQEIQTPIEPGVLAMGMPEMGGYNIESFNLGLGQTRKPQSSLYIGKFHGVNVYESSFFDEGTGVTFPGYGIFVYEGAYSLNKDYDLMRHEYGHILQANTAGYEFYYNTIAPQSFYNATRQKFDSDWYHNKFWTETSANRLSYKYFNYPLDWNRKRFPLY